MFGVATVTVSMKTIDKSKRSGGLYASVGYISQTHEKKTEKGSWLTRANNTAAHYAAIYCPRRHSRRNHDITDDRWQKLKSFPSLKAHWAALISVSLALSQTPVFTLRDHGYGASASRGVPVYVPAFAGTHCAYPRWDGQAELIWVTGYIPGWSPIQVLTGLGVD